MLRWTSAERGNLAGRHQLLVHDAFVEIEVHDDEDHDAEERGKELQGDLHPLAAGEQREGLQAADDRGEEPEAEVPDVEEERGKAPTPP